MKRMQIEETQWLSFVDDFSRRHAGDIVRVEVQPCGEQLSCIASGMHLQGISFDAEGTRSASLEISVSDDRCHNVTHVVDKPLFIRRALDRADQDLVLQIESARGVITNIILADTASCGGIKPSGHRQMS